MLRKLLNSVLVLLLIGVLVLLYLSGITDNLTIIIIGVAALIVSVLLLFLPAGRKREPEAAIPVTTVELQESPDPEEISQLKEDLDEARKKASFWSDTISQISREFLTLEASLPMVEKLAKLVSDKSEKSTLDVTTNIFSIADVSNDVSAKIQKLLDEMTEGNKSMESNISRLENEMTNLSGMEESFVGILDGYKNEIKTLSAAILSIKEFTESLTDLSERTHILAINASVEAARVGSKGAGFAVIAGEVQKLASRSKDIAANIKELTSRIDHQVHSSFRQQGEQIDEAVKDIQNSKGDVGDVVRVLAPQAKMISESIVESHRLSDNVTENLNKITVSLQFQDYIRQILEHITIILKERKDVCRQCFPEEKLDTATDYSILEEEVLEEIKKYFTIRDEYEILGLKFEEKNTDESKKEKTEGEFSGNVSLF